MTEKFNPETGELYYMPSNGEIFMRTPYNYDTDQESLNTATDCGPETKTQQQFKDEVDINTIVERFGVTGEMPPTMNFPTEQDFSETFDFQTSMNVLVQARESFMTLPAKARARFNNDPQQFMEFMHDPENVNEAIKMGLAVKLPEPQKPVEKPAEIKEKEKEKGDTK